MLIIREKLSVYEYWENGSLSDALRAMADDIDANPNMPQDIQHAYITETNHEGWIAHAIVTEPEY